MTDQPNHLEAAARRALQALGDLILDSSDPGVEALGAQYELRQALLGTAPEIPTQRVWQIESRRASGMWTSWSAATTDGDDARADYAETVAQYGERRAHRLVCAITTHVIEAQHQPEPEDAAANDKADQ
ncbi:hypothetical protein [Streptomyces sp. NPDC002088]|uniref:hypothetical protein n=1 Tax=Streptomyces sp. NPDC002088 TaxID=3154665 RepID=UPI00333429C3